MERTTENLGSCSCFGCLILLIGFICLSWVFEVLETHNTQEAIIKIITTIMVIIVLYFWSVTVNKNNKDKQQTPEIKSNSQTESRKQPNFSDLSDTILNHESNKIHIQQETKPITNEILSSVDNNLHNKNICESPIEEQFWEIAQHEIPGLIPQYHISRYRVDFALPDKHVIIELDGHEYHKTKKQRTADARRERNLQELGWRVIRFTGTEVYQDAQDCVEQVKRLIA